MLCSENYPNVLAFSFLDELQKEFITTYNMMKTNTAVRPYCFIEFGKGLALFVCFILCTFLITLSLVKFTSNIGSKGETSATLILIE
jgi:hypothetical protein